MCYCGCIKWQGRQIAPQHVSAHAASAALRVSKSPSAGAHRALGASCCSVTHQASAEQSAPSAPSAGSAARQLCRQASRARCAAATACGTCSAAASYQAQPIACAQLPLAAAALAAHTCMAGGTQEAAGCWAARGKRASGDHSMRVS